MSTQITQWASIAALVIIGPMLCLGAWRVRNRYFWAIVVLALLYPLGKISQSWLIGPGWIRWYMSDVGWVSFVGLILAFGNVLPFGGTVMDRIKIGVGIAFAVAVCVEWAQLSLPKANLASRVAPSAAGDWVDMGIFFLMYGVNLYLIFKMEPPTVVPVIVPPKPKKKRKKNGRR